MHEHIQHDSSNPTMQVGNQVSLTRGHLCGMLRQAP